MDLNAFSNLATSLKIFLTLPVSVASNGGSITKLNVIETYVRQIIMNTSP